jgi:flagellar hook-associated protein FlgK
MSDLLGISSTAVAAYQRALGTVSNNIANVSTEGYSRQTSTLAQSAPSKQANMFLGTGVLFTSVKRAFDTFAESNLRNSNTDLSTQTPMVEYTQRVMDIMGDDSVGLSSALDTFFESARSLSVDPASGVMRTSFLRSTEGVGSRFAELSGQLNLVADETRQALESASGQLNTLTEQLSLVNQQLTKGTSEDSQPPELLDRRDLLLRQMSEYSRIKTSFTSNGMVSVSLGTTMKQSLVVDGIRSRPVGMDPNSNSKLDMVIDPYGKTEPLSGASGGTFGGLNTFISQVLEPAQKNLDFLAQSFVDEVNKVQKNGIDGYGNMGQPLMKIDITAVSKAQGIGIVLSDPMRVATGALFRVTSNNDNASDVKAKVAYTPPPASLGVSNTKLINNPFTSTPVPIEVGGGRLYAPVTTLAAGMENPVIYLDNAKPGQQLQLLTRDGRQLIGSQMSIDEKYQVLTKENGFSEPVTFSDAYLNKSGPNGYLNTNVFYGAKGSVVYAQQFDRLGQPAAPTPTPAKLETAHIQQLQAGITGLTLIANGAIKLNNNPLGPLVLEARETLTPQKVAAWLQKGLVDNKISDMRVEVYNQIRFNASSLDYRKPLSINGINIGTVNQNAKVANEYLDMPSMVKAIQSAQDTTGVTARIADNGDLILENALGREGETITLGPKDVNGQSSNAFNLNLTGSNGVIQGQVRLTRTLGDPAKSDIRLSFGTTPNAGSPFDLSIVGLRTAAYIEGKVPDDLQVFVTGEGKASVAASFTGQPTDPQQKLRAQNLVVIFDAADHYTIKDGATGTVLAERKYDNTILNPVVNYQGLAVKFTRAPDVGDVFAVDGNRDGLGNNENMLVMADLARKGVIGNKSFSDSYIDQVNTVGNAAQQAKITQQALTVVNAQAKQSRDKVSGVNLDDEAADLIRFQQAYQAAAKSLQISGQLFDSIVQIR